MCHCDPSDSSCVFANTSPATTNAGWRNIFKVCKSCLFLHIVLGWQAEQFLLKSCRKGTPCTRNVHTTPQIPVSANICVTPGCGRPTHNGEAGEFCGKTCLQKYSRLPPSVQLKDYASIKAQGGIWLRKVFPYSQLLTNGASLTFYGNPGLGDRLCPAVQKYEAGLRSLGLKDSSRSEFAWHGTSSLANVKNICWDSLNPKLRSGQAYGRGEYFSTDASVSSSYSGSSGYLLVFLLLLGAHNSTHNGNYRVVDNPADGSSMYCLPLGVVDYRGSGDPKLKGSGLF
eukprot:CAMPEP_0114641074 /NCGR_PEP_ID=MMETSP0191-20121206/2054_1 /TAXON_ID=126664 /ORGANISM="Sorites sp." /LENGTH=284 /DNA_ID=CAMNT_0001853073 /DNA_START=104 /DNA_END=959 /DNA_ORIENTATION=+